MTQETLITVAVDFDDIRSIVRWGGGVLGIAESTFPHPKEWRLSGIDAPLDEITVKMITKALTARHVKEPSCIEAWKKRIGELPTHIGSRYNARLLTPRDWCSHFKNVTHRAMWTKAKQFDAKQADSDLCRCCGSERETICHLAEFVECGGEIFGCLRSMSGARLQTQQDRLRHALFAILPNGKPELEGWVNLHLLLWKQLVFLMVRMDTEDAAFDPKTVWKGALRRFETKAKTLCEKVRIQVRRAISRGKEAPKAD